MTFRWIAAGLGAVASAAGAQSIDEMKLVSAAQDCRAAEVAELLGAGVDVNARNSGGYTPLMMAAGNGCEPVVRLLLDKGADVSIKHRDFGDAAAQAKMNRNGKIEDMIRGGGAGAVPAPAPTQAAVPAARQQATARGGATARGWPKLGRYRVGQEVLYSGSGGKTWDRGVIKGIDPTYGYNIADVTGSNDAYFVVAPQREAFWTDWFVGDWKVSVPMAMGAVTDGRYVYRTVSGGLKLPPLRINADGSYSWRVQSAKGEQLIKGRWEPNPAGPGVVLKGGEQGADWLVYNNSRTGSTLGETVIIASDCCSHHDGSRLK